MSEPDIIGAARSGDRERLKALLDDGADVNTRDEQGWTPINYAAGKGDAEAVRLLLEHGADPTLTGRDNRTPLMIAKAANRKEVAEILTAAEKERGVWKDPRENRPYCKAYYLRDLRRFEGWSENAEDGDASEALGEDSIVYLHHDFTVTRSMWHGEDVVFEDVSATWKEFCEGKLEFAIPEDLL